MRLPAEHPRQALLGDEALLEAAFPGAAPLVRWWVASSAAIVLGLGMRHRLAAIVDLERCRRAGIEVLERRAGGGALLLDEHMLCGAVCVPLPDPRLGTDLTESYRWLGDLLTARLRARGVAAARRIEVAEARADVAAMKAHPDLAARLLLGTCYGTLSPHEVAIGNLKLVGIAQVRQRHAALFQFGILRRDQSPLADYLQVPDEPTRAQLRQLLRERTIGLDSLAGVLPLEPDQLL